MCSAGFTLGDAIFCAEVWAGDKDWPWSSSLVPPPPPRQPSPAAASPKRGLALHSARACEGELTAHPAASWYYSWGVDEPWYSALGEAMCSEPAEAAAAARAAGLEFVPMFWRPTSPPPNFGGKPGPRDKLVSKN